MATAPKFDPVSPELDFPAEERRILDFWRRQRTFEKTLERPDAPTFVFYEGPPTANGVPHNGHVLTRVIKDLLPRYKTMRGYNVPRKAGWDTHGLPVEVEVEKELRIHGKAEIEKYGVEPFTERCIESVFRYTQDWERLTSRIGFWVDLKDAYVTFHRSYVESVWWALAELWKKGLLYQGHKVVWWWAQGGTALSSAEVGLGYKTVDDPSAYVAFPLKDAPDTALLAWTTTPWTLPSNQFAAVHPELDYVTVDAGDRKLVLAEVRLKELEGKLGKALPVLSKKKGREWVGTAYRPPFDTYAKRFPESTPAWRVVAADFVTTDSGTGVVHIAPAFGEDDYGVLRREQAKHGAEAVPLICAIRPDGTFDADWPELQGRFVKEADKDVQRALKASGLLVHTEQYRHEYPFCWRADEDPLIQFARPAWYIRTTQVIERAKENNRQIRWVPESVGTGRFGDFLANNVDWALSRERYWGTPLPLWVHSETGEVEAVPSVAALREKPGNNVAQVEDELKRFLAGRHDSASENAEHLLVHKPWVDKITFEKPGAKGRFVRVPEVIDCWFDSGCMPFAQWGYPHAPGSKEKFQQAFPADFISEAIDQTRGWFYTLLMVSTLLFDEQKQPHPYKTCIVLGHVSDKEGKKESKSKGNYTPPEIILDRVAMEFAVLDEAPGAKPAPGVALIAREDLEGLDLAEGAQVTVGRADRPEAQRTFKLQVHKKLPRRVVALSEEDRRALDVTQSERGMGVMPVEVPRLPVQHRVELFDPQSRAPGADAFRWFFYAASPTWSNTRHSLSNVRQLQKDFQIKLRNVYSFFTIYANIDGFDPAAGSTGKAPLANALRASEGCRAVKDRPLLDRWVLSELQLTVRDVTSALEQFQVHQAAQRLVEWVEALSNWYLRRSRARFWGSGLDQDKRDAYFTLYEALTTTSLLCAPFTPFFAETMYQNLVVRPWGERQPSSVHLATWPEARLEEVETPLTEEMSVVRELVSVALKVRTDHRLKVRQPLARADVVLANAAMVDRVKTHAALIADEVNVHDVAFLKHGEEAGRVRNKPRLDLRAVGPRLGAKLAAVRKAWDAKDPEAIVRELRSTGATTLLVGDETMSFPLTEVEMRVEAVEGFAAASTGSGVVILHTELTDALKDEGLVRELLARVQAARKELNLGYTERITVAVEGSERAQRVFSAAAGSISKETLASAFQVGAPQFAPRWTEEASLNGEAVKVAVAPA